MRRKKLPASRHEPFTSRIADMQNTRTAHCCRSYGNLFNRRFFSHFKQHKSLGTSLQLSFMPEVLCGLLQLSFSPTDVASFPEDVSFFRNELEVLFSTIPAPDLLKGILFLKGIASQKKVCWILFIRV